MNPSLMTRHASSNFVTTDASVTAGGTLPIDVQGLSHRYPPARRTKASSNRRRNHKDVPDPEATLERPALQDVSLQVQPGELFGILGPNGSGKTTLFRILSTLLTPTAGSVRVFGHDLLTQPDRVRRELGVVFQMPSLDDQLTTYENLMHQGHLYGVSGARLQQRIDELLAQFDLQSRREQWAGTLSGGLRRRIELAKALLHRPRLLLLDEPSTGLDPAARIELWRVLGDLQQHGVTIALTTHLMDEADRCTRLAVMSQGRLVALDTPANLKARIGGDVITLEAEDAQPSSLESLRGEIQQRWGPWNSGAEPVVVEGRIRFERVDGAGFIPTIASALPGKIRSLSVGKPTLEDVFVHLTGQKLWQAPGEN